MSVIIVPRRWTQQPTGPVEIDWNHPLTVGLQEALHPTHVWDAVRRIPLIQSGSVTAEKTVAKFGEARQFGTSRIMSTGPTNAVPETVLPRTLFFQHQLGVFSVQRLYHRSTAGNATPVELFRTTGSFNYEYGRKIGAVQVGNSRWSGTLNIASNLVLTNDGATAANTALYQNNTLLTRAGTGISVFAAAVLTDRIYLGSSGSGTEAADTKMSLFMLWTRILTRAEIAEISRNPWQIFKPISSRIYFDYFASSGFQAAWARNRSRVIGAGAY